MSEPAAIDDSKKPVKQAVKKRVAPVKSTSRKSRKEEDDARDFSVREWITPLIE
jgi:hypothetical protein